VEIALFASGETMEHLVVSQFATAARRERQANAVSNGSAPRLDDVRVRDALGLPLITCPPDTPMNAVADLMATNHVDTVVVDGIGGVEPWGVVTDRSLLRVAREAATRVAGSCVTGRLLAIDPDEPLEVAIQVMRSHGVSHLMVIDPERKVPLGVLSTLDIARVVAGGRSYRTSSPAR
jgi:CBS domain-containing protein